MKRTSEAIRSGALLFVSMVIAFLLLEILARSLYESPQVHLYPQIRYDEHLSRYFTLKPNQVAYTYNQVATITSDGFRSNGHTDFTSTNCVILFALGDSFTFGMGVGDSETWPALLEQLNPNLCVINGGTISYGVRQELNYFREHGLPMKPNIVIHGLYWNDFMGAQGDSQKLLTNDGHFIWDGDNKPSLVGWIKEHSTVAFIISTLIRRAITPKSSGLSGYALASAKLIGGSIDESEWEGVRTFYKEMKELARNHKFVFAVVIMPVREIADQPQHPYPIFVRKLLKDYNIPYVDGFELWKKHGIRGGMFLPYNDHLNADGYKIIAEEMSPFIKGLINSYLPSFSEPLNTHPNISK